MQEMEGSEIVEIADDDGLYRRLGPNHFYPDGTVNSNAYKFNGKPAPSISVDLGRLTTPAEALARAGGRPGWGLGELMAATPRSLEFSVEHDPNPEVEPLNVAHSLIRGENSRKKCQILALNTSVRIAPE